MMSSNDVINPPKIIIFEICTLANYMNDDESILVNASFYIDKSTMLYEI